MLFRSPQIGFRPPVPQIGAPPVGGKVVVAPKLCFICQLPGHLVRNFPNNARNNQVARPGQAAPARAFTVMPGNENVQGSLKLFHSNVRVLFDTGASHSFISRQYVLREGIPVKPLLVPVCIGTPLRGSVTLYEHYKDFVIDLGDKSFLVDLIILGFEGFSIILVIDWP